MSIEVTMGSFSPLMVSARLVSWLSQPGELVEAGQPIAEIESDKAVMDILAPCSGWLQNVVAAAGQELIGTGQILAHISEQELVATSAPTPSVDGSDQNRAKDKGSSDSATSEILMPSLAPSMESANLVRWLVTEGDIVTVGQVVAEIETDKATLEVEVSEAGTIRELFVEAGSNDVPVGAKLALLELARPPKIPVAADEHSAFSEPQVEKPAIAPFPRAEINDAASSIDTHSLNSAETTAPSNGNVAVAGLPQTIFVDADTVRLFPAESFELVPHSAMRKTIARRLTESKQSVPHFYVSVDCHLDPLLALRLQLNQLSGDHDTPKAFRISVNDMVIKAHALALRDVPEANVSWTDAAMLHHKQVDVGVAVSIPGGLITPIVRRADTKPLSFISREMNELASRARTNGLRPEEYVGGTTAVSNLGMFGVGSFSAIVNPPHATILAVGAGAKAARIVNGDAIEIATVMTATLSTDHRAVDGALAAALLSRFKFYIENPMAMLA